MDHRAFVTTRPRLQQSVTMKRMGTYANHPIIQLRKLEPSGQGDATFLPTSALGLVRAVAAKP